MALWVFAYGSLIWNPEFDVAEQSLARLGGFARSFCMRSIHHRGSEEDPGLVLALDTSEGASCDGVAFRVAGDEAACLEALRARELISSAYVETWQHVTLQDNRRVQAVTYVINRDHWQYCAGLSLEEQAQIIAEAHGGRGPNWEYLNNTAQHLREIGLSDSDLNWLEQRVGELRAEKTLTLGEPRATN
ncbi:MAG: gamma-glutamylcyclotransferase [Pseudomonadota bacterium]